MALTKNYLKTKKICKVGFKVSAAEIDSAAKVALVGEFSDWKPKAMRKLKDGSFSLNVEMASGREYQFRYLLDGERWVNDPDADSYVFNEFAGCENSVVNV